MAGRATVATGSTYSRCAAESSQSLAGVRHCPVAGDVRRGAQRRSSALLPRYWVDHVRQEQQQQPRSPLVTAAAAAADYSPLLTPTSKSVTDEVSTHPAEGENQLTYDSASYQKYSSSRNYNIILTTTPASAHGISGFAIMCACASLLLYFLSRR